MLNEELEDVVNENELDTSEEMEPCISQSRILSEFGSLEAFERFKKEEKCGERRIDFRNLIGRCSGEINK